MSGDITPLPHTFSWQGTYLHDVLLISAQEQIYFTFVRLYCYIRMGDVTVIVKALNLNMITDEDTR
jgi:hypothetical protein